jgi:uncharacterized protein with GYD domain
MPMYMSQFAYTPAAWAGLVKSPEDRAEAAGALATKLGARVVSLYFCFGEYDGVVMFEAPDDATATAFMVAAISPGHVRSTRTTRLMTGEEMREALGKAGGVTYAAPRGMSG